MDVEKMFGNAVGELEKMLSSKSVVGEAIKVGDATMVPLVSIGFGFGAGGGTGSAPNKQGSGEGGGIGGGGGVRPIAVLVADKNGVRLESLRTAGSVIGRVAESITEMVGQRKEGRGASEGGAAQGS